MASYHVFRNRRAAALVTVLTLALALSGCNWFRDFDFARGARLTGGNPEAGRKKLAMHSCGSCHFIPGVPRAEGNRQAFSSQARHQHARYLSHSGGVSRHDRLSVLD
ncbi:MAG: hypothetical protein ABR908_00165 [Terriglobales bacterium]